MLRFIATILLLASFNLPAADNAIEVTRTPAPEGAEVYFIEPTDGATVPTTFTVKFGLRNMGVAPAGTDKAATGHHHLLIDQELPALDRPMGGDIMHFGGGQTETEVTLEPGEHDLRLIVGDKNHVPHDPPIYSEQITVTVVE
ncbi:DUF4399 domain-containing protein [Halochromatium glycolicum]|uniref:Rod shape-determining protein RodA n=1 Tax=Halochromatium glycolicum TaxID=85075 RepID=A0AAJ0U448_9GAMM|nr:DUF4399 domain-containing protein [Halochromatium glycolicum]MBK1704948.1 rod shape-determining protein RodA [Halochromatium glycolicum]